MQKKPSVKFPKRFLWGVSTAAHQVEGNNHNQWSVWELEHAKSRAAQAEYHMSDLDSWEWSKTQAKDPNNYVSSSATDHYAQYEADFDIAKSLGLNAFRFSVEWSRVEPNEGGWNVEAIEHYKQYVAALKKRGLEPVMTLFHFTLPVWFVQKGGFEKRANIKYFLRFSEKILSELGNDIKFIITINEPEVYIAQSYLEGNWPPSNTSKWTAYKVIKNLIRTHNKTAKMIHGMNRRYRVSIAKNSPYFYPGDDAWLTRCSTAVMQYVQDDYILKRVYKQCDYLGVNYYFSNRVYGYRIHNPEDRKSDMGWAMEPENLEYVLERLHKKYKLPILITENGLADAKDSDRKWWLSKTMIAISNALSEGVDVKGYLHWSLTDNFEWAFGKWPRFGLVEIDYKTGKRTIRPSGVWWKKIIANIQKSEK